MIQRQPITHNNYRSLHDALPIYPCRCRPGARTAPRPAAEARDRGTGTPCLRDGPCRKCRRNVHCRSEEDASELQSHVKIVCRRLLEKIDAGSKTLRAPTEKTLLA